VLYYEKSMSQEEFSQGIEFIEVTAKRFDLSLGSRHEDFSRGSVRLSVEKSIELSGRRLFRTPVFELSRAFVRDLPGSSKYKESLVTFLQSLSLRILHPKPLQFLTRSGVPFEADIRWPFRPVQDSDESFVHVFVRVGSQRPEEANFTVLISGPDQIQIGPSLSPPTVDSLVINSIRVTIDQGHAKFYLSGQHPTVLQQVRIAPPAPDKPSPDDAGVEEFIKRKIYWLGFREGDDKTLISISDPYDCFYLGRSAQRLKQMASVLAASSSIRLDASGQYAYAADGLLAESAKYERDLADLLGETQKITRPDNSAGTSDIGFHYPPELLRLLIDTIPLLCRSKKDVLLFFKGAGVSASITNSLTARVNKGKDSITKYEIARTVLTRLNEKGEATLRERREVLKRVVRFEDFSTCRPTDQLKAKGLVGEVRRVVDVKDSFARMKQERGKPSGTVFISYNTDDAPFANALASALRSRDIKTWIDEEEIRVGDSLIGRIGRALHNNDFIVVVLSPSSVRSEWVRLELKEALTREISERRVVVLPVIARTCEIPPFLKDKKYADFTRNSDVALDALVRAIQHQSPPIHP
jgi:hypothetical protein